MTKTKNNIIRLVVFLNGNRKAFYGEKKKVLNELNKDIKSYGMTLNSIRLNVEENEISYDLSLLSAVHYIVTGVIGER